jgi:hypothetical protein
MAAGALGKAGDGWEVEAVSWLGLMVSSPDGLNFVIRDIDLLRLYQLILFDYTRTKLTIQSRADFVASNTRLRMVGLVFAMSALASCNRPGLLRGCSRASRRGGDGDWSVATAIEMMGSGGSRLVCRKGGRMRWISE